MLQSKIEADTDAAFSAEELENSFPLDLGRRFRHPAGHSLLQQVIAGMEAEENRERVRGRKAEARYHATVEAMLANLVAGHRNAVDPYRFIGVGFDRNDYVGLDVCRDAMARCRDYLLREGLVELQSHFHRWDADGIGTFGRRTRIRPSEVLRSLIDCLQAEHRTLTIPDRQLIRMKKPSPQLGPMPDDVEASREIIKAVNQRIAGNSIELEDMFLAALRAKVLEYEGEDADDKDRKRSYAGDLTATALYRSFKGDWNSGGRLYGGWWMSLPRSLRPYLKINGSPVVELDYKTLHPLLLFMRIGIPLDFDPYKVEANTPKPMRDLGKRTFNRLLNRTVAEPAKRLSMRAASGDPAILPKGTSFKSYLATLVRRLGPVQRWFGTGEGVRLQREDSELALSILSDMERAGIVVLPVHDSFIVAKEHEEDLHKVMVDAFHSRHGAVPEIKAKRPRLDLFQPPTGSITKTNKHRPLARPIHGANFPDGA